MKYSLIPLTQKIPLVTANEKDFEHLKEIEIINPIK